MNSVEPQLEQASSGKLYMNANNDTGVKFYRCLVFEQEGAAVDKCTAELVDAYNKSYAKKAAITQVAKYSMRHGQIFVPPVSVGLFCRGKNVTAGGGEGGGSHLYFNMHMWGNSPHYCNLLFQRALLRLHRVSDNINGFIICTDQCLSLNLKFSSSNKNHIMGDRKNCQESIM